MNAVDLSGRLDRLERSNRQLRAIVLGLTVIVIGLTTVVSLRPWPVEAQGRVIEAQAFVLIDGTGAVRGQFSLGPDGQPSLRMWQGPGGVEAEGTSPFISLGTATPDRRGGTYFTMGDSPNGLVTITTGRDGQRPSATMFQSGGDIIWSAP
jgi:hypothetical protein